MNDVSITGGVLVDTASVVFKGIGNSDTTGNRSTLVDLLHHGLLALDFTKLVNAIDEVLVGNEAVLVRVAVFADVDWGALNTVIVTTGLVNRASFIGDVVVVHELEGREGETTMATVVIH